MQFKDWLTIFVLCATIFAIVWGPIKAVQITRDNDEEREKQRRQFEVFHALMKTRRFTLAADHVMALNLVQVEFYQHPRIDTAYRTYIALLHGKFPEPGDPDAQRFFESKDDALYDLLHEIADELGYKYDKRDLRRLAYGPQGWQNDEDQQRAARVLLIELLSGKRAMPVIDFERLMRAAQGKFPPPPDTL
jgi:hypothetical protein